MHVSETEVAATSRAVNKNSPHESKVTETIRANSSLGANFEAAEVLDGVASFILSDFQDTEILN